MLPHLVLIEQAASKLFSICKRCGKGNREKVAARGTVGSRGGPGMAAIFGPGDQLFCHGQSREGGEHFQGGTVYGMTADGK